MAVVLPFPAAWLRARHKSASAARNTLAALAALWPVRTPVAAACMRPCQTPRFALRYGPFRVAIRPVLSGVQGRLAGRPGHGRCLPGACGPRVSFCPCLWLCLALFPSGGCELVAVAGHHCAAGTCMPVSHGCRCQSGSVAAIVIFFLSLFMACLCRRQRGPRFPVCSVRRRKPALPQASGGTGAGCPGAMTCHR